MDAQAKVEKLKNKFKGTAECDFKNFNMIFVVNSMLFAFVGEYAKSIRRSLIMCKINESLAYGSYFRILHPIGWNGKTQSHGTVPLKYCL
jgi:hypothetical protein